MLAGDCASSRLKGGDPLVFSRGGEEIAWLADQDVAFEVVPGVTAASACAAIAGIPLTHRNWAQSVRFVTARAQDGLDLDWSEAAKPDQTLVVYMGLKVLAAVCEHLVSAGADAETPAAAISRATLPDQRVVAGSLATLASRVRKAGLKGPLTTIVGQVASLARDTSSTE